MVSILVIPELLVVICGFEGPVKSRRLLNLPLDFSYLLEANMLSFTLQGLLEGLQRLDSTPQILVRMCVYERDLIGFRLSNRSRMCQVPGTAEQDR